MTVGNQSFTPGFVSQLSVILRATRTYCTSYSSPPHRLIIIVMASSPNRTDPTATAPAAAPESVLLPDGRLNGDFLRREVASDVSLDDRYRAEDAMKKRAIHSCEFGIILELPLLACLVCPHPTACISHILYSFIFPPPGPGKNYDEFRNLVLASQLKPVNQAEMSQLFGGGGGDASTVGSIKSRVGNAGAMNKAFNVGHGGDGGGDNGGVGGILSGLYDPSVAAADRGRAVLAAAAASSSSDTSSSMGKRGDNERGGSLFDQSNPAELEGLDWKRLQKKMAKKNRTTSKKTNANKTSKKKTSGTAPPSSSSSPPKSMINPQQFEREWRRSCTDAASTARYLLRTESGDGGGVAEVGAVQTHRSVGSKSRLILRPEEASRTVFKVELGSDVMGDILAALAHLCRLASASPSSLDDDGQAMAADAKDGSTNNDVVLLFRPGFVYRWMMAMSKCGRFDLNVSFLTGDQKQDVEYIVATLEKCIDGGWDDDAAYDSDGFTEEDVMRVRELYK